MGKVIKIETEDLVRRMKERDTEAYKTLMKMYESELTRIARTKIQNEEDVKDVVQETFATVYFSIHTLKDNKKFKSWLITILANKCKKLNKRIANRKETLENNTNYKEIYSEDYADEGIDFENLVKDLNEKERKILKCNIKMI